jgi:hypothetical protein
MALVMAAATAVSAAASSAAASERWRHVALSRHRGSVEATLSYDRRRAGVAHEYRRLSLVVRRAGAVVIRDRADARARLGDVRDLSLRNVWGSAQPEALVELWTGGNRCCVRLDVGVVDGQGHGRVLIHEFPTYTGAKGEWHDRRFDFVSADARFDCAFTACAGESQPIRIFAIDRAGRRFVDVTRSRPDLIRMDAAEHWQWVKHGSRYPVGELAPWCADQYLLAKERRCDRVLAEAMAYGGFDGWHGSGKAFIRLLRARLRTWGYG